ncbi:uncharacterized protein C16orf78 homolog [Heteronotia binoei]|uniref:uncharacterized protein C16orf78 homolog n=1 Tax=Heteronotia binoei TaxID=13085 RepID=UPI00292FB12E|nr:uncharacterized protein C16orf78 homolog [Heteronotia binoei]
MDWLDNKRAKALRVSNDRETFQLKKIRRSLDSMKTMNDNLLKQEERKVKRWLKKQGQASGSYPESSHGTRPASGKESFDITWSQFGNHLPNFVSFLRLPTKRPSYDRKNSKDLTPFSGNDLPVQTLLARNTFGPRNSMGNTFPPSRDSRKGSSPRQSSLENSVSLQEAMALFPSLQRLSTKGDRLSFSKPPLHNSVSGFPALQKKLKTMLEKARGDEMFKPPEPLAQIRPEEILSCRYLRLSQSNIETLVSLCKESGIDIDIHPHMKESEINITTVLSSNPSRTF